MKKIYVVTYTNVEDYLESDVYGNALAFDNKEEAEKLISELNSAEFIPDVENVISKYVEHNDEIAKNICNQIFDWYHDGEIKYDIEEINLI